MIVCLIQGMRMFLVNCLGTHARPRGDLRPAVASLTQPSDLIALAEPGHGTQSTDSPEGEFGIVVEAQGTGGVTLGELKEHIVVCVGHQRTVVDTTVPRVEVCSTVDLGL